MEFQIALFKLQNTGISSLLKKTNWILSGQEHLYLENSFPSSDSHNWNENVKVKNKLSLLPKRTVARRLIRDVTFRLLRPLLFDP